MLLLLNFAEQMGLRQSRRTGALPPDPSMQRTLDPLELGQRILKIARSSDWSSPAIRAGLSADMRYLCGPTIGDALRNGDVDWPKIVNSLAPEVRKCVIDTQCCPQLCRRAAHMGLPIELLVLSVMALSRAADDPEVAELVVPAAGGRTRDFPHHDVMFAAFGLQPPAAANGNLEQH
ncbi:MAG: hypothetical protein QM780_10335 [Hyphomicrobium sp.]|uniref:hypothetical protein n=1 Tax=Hyphomicrobium sp. TaxID=82 RepID=UPI0039E59CA4